MCGLLLAILLTSASDSAHTFRLVDDDQTGLSWSLSQLTQKQLLTRELSVDDDRPSLASVIVPMSFGVLFGTAGTFSLPFGLVLIGTASGSVLSGVAIALGLIFAIAGAAVLIGGIICFIQAARNLKARAIATEELEEIRFLLRAAPPAIDPPAPPPSPTQVRAGPQQMVLIAQF